VTGFTWDFGVLAIKDKGLVMIKIFQSVNPIVARQAFQSKLDVMFCHKGRILNRMALYTKINFEFDFEPIFRCVAIRTLGRSTVVVCDVAIQAEPRL
jgi:hypothetical protein